MIIKFSTYLANKISGQVSLSQRDQVALRFGFQLLLGEGFKLVIFLVVAYFLGVTQEVFIIAMVAALLRGVSGGVHCSTFGHCLLVCTVGFNVLGMIARWIADVLPHTCLLGIILSVYLLSWWVIYFWVPAENPNRPIRDISEKIKFRKMSFGLINLWLIINFLIWGTGYYYPCWESFVIAATLGVLWQIFSVTPFGYRIFYTLDRGLSFLKKDVKEVV